MRTALINPADEWLGELRRRTNGSADLWIVFADGEAFLEAAARQSWDAVVIAGAAVESASGLHALLSAIRSSARSAKLACVWPERNGNPGLREEIEAAGIHTVSARSSEQIAELLLVFVRDQEGIQRPFVGDGSRLAAFIGSTPNIGTTVVAFGSAVLLANSTDASIGYLCLNLKSSKLHRYVGKEEPPYALDHLRAELRAQSLSGARLKQYAEPIKGVPNLSLLFGSVQREQAEFYQPEDISHLLSVARQAFDACIVEVNAYWDNAATVSAMLDADERVCVTTADLGHFQEDLERGLKTMTALYRIPAQSFSLVVNQLDRQQGKGGIRTADICKETGMQIVAEIERYPELLEYVNQGRLTRFFVENDKFPGQLSGIVARLHRQLGLPSKHEEARKAWIKRLLPNLGAHG